MCEFPIRVDNIPREHTATLWLSQACCMTRCAAGMTFTGATPVPTLLMASCPRACVSISESVFSMCQHMVRTLNSAIRHGSAVMRLRNPQQLWIDHRLIGRRGRFCGSSCCIKARSLTRAENWPSLCVVPRVLGLKELRQEAPVQACVG